MTDDDTPITLGEACRLVFRDRITPCTLVAEAKRGRLAITKIGRRYFTTLASVRAMVEQCHVEPRGHAYTSTRSAGHGASETERQFSAQAALKKTVLALKKH